MHFAPDGTLLISNGDGSHWEWPDDGIDRTPYDVECATIFGVAQDIGSLRSQDDDSMGGKILRIDADTGNGIGPDNFPALVSNPYYDPANPYSARSRIWAKGFRNPFRFASKLLWLLFLTYDFIKVRTDAGIGSDGIGTILLSDVGYASFEEINIIKRGANYGCKNIKNFLKIFQ